MNSVLARDLPAPERTPLPRTLRLLSFNIQAGASVDRYRQYLTRGWQHVLPHPLKLRNLAAMAQLIVDFDIVGLQEADGGSLRSGFRNQLQYLAENAEFPFWAQQANRRLGGIAESGNGLLARSAPSAVLDHRLPGAIKGRGVLEVRFGAEPHSLRVFVAHLALTPGARRKQVDYLIGIIGAHPHVVLMGDLNCEPGSRELAPLFVHTELRTGMAPGPSFPSWQPKRRIDHILVSRQLQVVKAEALALKVSDHLPVALTLNLPENCAA